MQPEHFDFTSFDIPAILRFVFYPRTDYPHKVDGAREISIEVDEGVSIGGRLFRAQSRAPLILFFHGNGEIVSDYDDIGRMLSVLNISFLTVDYRGYGLSGGTPSVSSMMSDSLKIFSHALGLRDSIDPRSPFIIMGRSLGSASALELVYRFAGKIDGLIIDSGFAKLLPLLSGMGIDCEGLGLTEEGFDHINKISSYAGPTLLIHGDQDQLIPYAHGLELYNACSDSKKSFFNVKGAGHNNIFQTDIQGYINAIRQLCSRVVSEKS